MRVVASSTDPVRIGFLAALLRDAGIGCTVLDAHISALEGGIGAFPRRLAVAAADADRARRVLQECGEGGQEGAGT
jgi:Putative prokaryotic signal transducing protein